MTTSGVLFCLLVVFVSYSNSIITPWELVEDLDFSNNHVGLWTLQGNPPTIPTISKCGDYNSLGGVHGLGGPHHVIQWGPYTYPNAEIKEFRVTMTYLAIDSWDGHFREERLYVYYNNIKIQSFRPDKSDIESKHMCGNGGWPDSAREETFIISLNKTIPSLTITMQSSLDQDVYDESWGLAKWKLEVRPSCDPCAINNNQQCNGDSVASCIDINAGCKRLCNCPTGYTGTQTLNNINRFSGCTLINYCTQNNNQQCNSDPLATCTPTAPFQRTCTCPSDYTGTATLSQNTPFTGCVAKDSCITYGPVLGSSGKPDNVISCIPGYNTRTVTCAPGYYVTATKDTSITLNGNATFPGCFDIDECAIYGNSNRPQFVESCKNGINNRTITCVLGAQPVPVVPNASRSIVITGGSEFKGCEVVCGDGLLTPPETCDDGNGESGDGCSNTCQTEPGWVCQVGGEKCCPYFYRGDGVDIVSQKLLECYHGFWTSPNLNRSQPIVLDSLVHISQDISLCGDYVLESGTLFLNNSVLHIAGSLTVGAKSLIHFANNSQLIIDPPCSKRFGNYTEDEVHLKFTDSNTTILLTAFYWPNNQVKPMTPIWATFCTDIRGNFNVLADEIPSGSNDFVLIYSNSSCNHASKDEDDVFEAKNYDLPGGCSNLDVNFDETEITVTLNRKALCPGHIAGIVIGVIAFVGIIGIVAAVTMGGTGGASPDGYVGL